MIDYSDTDHARQDRTWRSQMTRFDGGVDESYVRAAGPWCWTCDTWPCCCDDEPWD